MSRSVRGWMRSLHLYVGLAVSPFVILYAASTLALNHPALLRAADPPAVEGRRIRAPQTGDDLAYAREVLRQVGVTGEVMFVSRDLKSGEVKIPVQRAGAKAQVRVVGDQAWVERARPSLIASLTFFHKMPGPHVAKLRGNSLAISLWRWMADAAVLSILFLAASGLYLWTALRAERRLGLACLVGGAAVFAALVTGLVL